VPNLLPLRACRGRRPLAFLLPGAFLLALILPAAKPAKAEEGSIFVNGDVLEELLLSPADLKAMPPFFIENVPLIPERVRDGKDLDRVSQTHFRGVLLRDLLHRAGMKHKRKWEPGVVIRVVGQGGKEVVFSFGEIFYSSTGRSILVAYERNGKPRPPTLVVATDIHDGRMMEGVAEIRVSRVAVQLLAYDDKDNKVTRPPTREFALRDTNGGSLTTIRQADIEALPQTHIPAAVMIGDCEGYHGIHTLDGAALATLLRKHLAVADPAPYDRYVLVTSNDGYSAVYSFGELFNSRMGNQVVIAVRKDGQPLTPADGFAMSVTGEDSTGGRSVRRIEKIEVH
jgi:hypothetical protein